MGFIGGPGGPGLQPRSSEEMGKVVNPGKGRGPCGLGLVAEPESFPKPRVSLGHDSPLLPSIPEGGILLCEVR